ncbi:MAG: FG-GAP-like repeat-containing protein, partial [Acidobacteriota bacterium]
MSVSADGSTAIVGGDADDNYAGAAWIWARNGGVWGQQGQKLVGSGAQGAAQQGWSASLSADGNTAIVGGLSDNGGRGAAWIWTRTGGVWTQQGPKLVGTGAVGSALQGWSVSISGDGNTAIVGGIYDNSEVGAAWIWTRAGGVWTPQGPKLVGSGGAGGSERGYCVSLSFDGNTAIVGGDRDNSFVGAAWVWTRSGGVWSQQGGKLVGAGAVGSALQGGSVALSGDGNTAIVGGASDNSIDGAAWIWIRNAGVWTQQGGKLVGSGAAGHGNQGWSVSLSTDGSTAMVGGKADDTHTGAAWVWTRSAGLWSQRGNKLVGSGAVGSAAQGWSVSVSADGGTAIVGGFGDNGRAGAAWVFAIPACTFSLAAPATSIPASLASGSVTLTASDPTCAWTAISHSEFITVTSPSVGTGTTTVAWSSGANTIASARTGLISTAGLTFTITQAAAMRTRRVPNDFNHNGVSDLGVFRPSAGRFLISGRPDTVWGAAGDLPVAGDFNGDGRPEIAVFRPSNGTWYIEGGATIVWGAAGDIPAPGDYDGNGTTDIAVFRPSAGIFYIRDGATVAWGRAGDLPVVADYNGDGIDDVAVYRPANGTWYVRDLLTVAFGLPADVPVPGDYNGDGATDIAVFRPATGMWFIKDQYTQAWGAAGDVPVPLDRDGDGVADVGVFRRSSAIWYFSNHVTGASETVGFGAIADLPLGRAMPPVQTPWGDADGDRKADLTVFRPSTVEWIALRSLSAMTDYTRHQFGLTGDTPVAR